MPFAVNVTPEDFTVDPALTHLDQTEKYRLAYLKLQDAEKQANDAKDRAMAEGDAQLLLESMRELNRISVFWTPFITGVSKAETFKKESRALADINGAIAPSPEGYIPDPIVTLFMIILQAVAEDFYEKFGDKTQQLVDQEITLAQYGEALVQLTPGLRILQDFRDYIISPDDNGEIAKLVRDPIKRPIEIVQNIRDGIIDPKDNGEIARIIRDPIKRPVEVVSNVVKNIFGW